MKEFGAIRALMLHAGTVRLSEGHTVSPISVIGINFVFDFGGPWLWRTEFKPILD